MKGWLSKTGFGRIKVTDLDGTVMLTGRKV
jgi:hypothetical protein